MGKFGEQLTGALTEGVMNAATGGVGGLISTGLGLINNIVGQIGAKSQAKIQKDLQEHQARTNYEYNEKAAENAFDRQRMMYAQTLNDNSAAAQRQRLEDAGLSVGLMYGGGGSAGAGSGSTSGGTQGGAQGPSGAGNAAAMHMAALEDQRLVLDNQRMAADVKLMESQARLNNVKAEESLSNKDNLAAQTETLNAIRKYAIEAQKQEATKKWLENVQERMKLEGDSDSIKYENKELQLMIIVGEDSYSRKMLQNTIENSIADTNVKKELERYYKEIGETQESIRALNESMEALNNERVKYVALEAYSDYVRALAEFKNANTNEFNSEVEKQYKNGVLKIQTYLANLKNTEIGVDIQKFEIANRTSFAESIFKAMASIALISLGGLVAGPGGAMGGAALSVPVLYNADGSRAATMH